MSDQVRRSRLVVTYDGVDITADVSPYIIGFAFTERARHGESDELSIAFQNVDQLWNNGWWPERGASMDDHTEPLLTTLAWQLSMINEPAWGQADDDDTKRQLLKGAIELHRHKGTPWAVREVMRILGYGEIGLIEGIGGLYYDGTGKHDGVYVYGQENAWAIYTVILSRQITAEEERALRAVLALIAPARDWLDQFIVED